MDLGTKPISCGSAEASLSRCCPRHSAMATCSIGVMAPLGQGPNIPALHVSVKGCRARRLILFGILPFPFRVQGLGGEKLNKGAASRVIPFHKGIAYQGRIAYQECMFFIT